MAQGAPWKGKETKLGRRPRGFHPRDLIPWLTESSRAGLLHPLEESTSESGVFLTQLNWEDCFGRSQLSKKEYIYFFLIDCPKKAYSRGFIFSSEAIIYPSRSPNKTLVGAFLTSLFISSTEKQTNKQTSKSDEFPEEKFIKILIL